MSRFRKIRFEAAGNSNALGGHFRARCASRLKAQRTSRVAEPGFQGIAPGQVSSLSQAQQAMPGLIERSYGWDAAGQLSQILDKQRGLNRYGYDAIGRITSSQIGIGRDWAALGNAQGASLGTTASDGTRTTRMAANEVFAWDAASNPLDPQASAQANGQRITQDGGQTFQKVSPIGAAKGNRLLVWQDEAYRYDIHGNLIERIQGKRGSQGQTITTFTWDAAHQLTQAQVTRGVDSDTSKAVTQTFSYSYDALGRRISKTDAFGSTVFTWNGDQLHSEERGNNKTSYLYEPDSFVPLAQIHDGQVHHLHTDHLGTPLEATNEQGEITWRVTYKTWGNVVVEEVQEIQQKLRFQGQYFDQETGLHYNRFRYYDPGVGRFVSQDPIGLRGGLNTFQYAPNPVGWVDPFGWKCTRDLRKSMAAAGMLLEGHQNHHIIPESVWNSMSQDCKNKLKLEPNSAYNGMALPCSSESQKNRGRNNKAAIHNSNHRNYNSAVKNKLESICAAGGDMRKDMFRYINELRNNLTSGGNSNINRIGALR